MNPLLTSVAALSFVAVLSVVPSPALAYSAGDTCVLTKVVELRIDPRSSGKKRYLKPGTEVIIIEKFRKRARVQVGDTLGTLGNRPISKACSWKTEEPTPEPEPEPEPEPVPPNQPEEPDTDSIELPPPPPLEQVAEAPKSTEATAPETGSEPALDPAPPLTWPPVKKSEGPVDDESDPASSSASPTMSQEAEPLSRAVPDSSSSTLKPWVDIIVGGGTFLVGAAVWVHASGLESALNDDAVAYNASDTRVRNTWFDINHRQTHIDHRRMIAMTSMSLGFALAALGGYDLLFGSAPSVLTDASQDTPQLQLVLSPRSIEMNVGF